MPWELGEDYKNYTAKAAFYSACNAATLIDGDRQSLDWWCAGRPDGIDWSRNQAIAVFSDFVEASPGAPAEALWRHAAARGFHPLPADGWEALELPWRLGYEAFVATLPVLDRVVGEAYQRQVAAARAAMPSRPAASDVPIEDTILAPLPDPLATNPNMVLVAVPQAGAVVDPLPDADPTIDATPVANDVAVI